MISPPRALTLTLHILPSIGADTFVQSDFFPPSYFSSHNNQPSTTRGTPQPPQRRKGKRDIVAADQTCASLQLEELFGRPDASKTSNIKRTETPPVILDSLDISIRRPQAGQDIYNSGLFEAGPQIHSKAIADSEETLIKKRPKKEPKAILPAQPTPTSAPQPATSEHKSNKSETPKQEDSGGDEASTDFDHSPRSRPTAQNTMPDRMNSRAAARAALGPRRDERGRGRGQGTTINRPIAIEDNGSAFSSTTTANTPFRPALANRASSVFVDLSESKDEEDVKVKREDVDEDMNDEDDGGDYDFDVVSRNGSAGPPARYLAVGGMDDGRGRSQSSTATISNVSRFHRILKCASYANISQRPTNLTERIDQLQASLDEANGRIATLEGQTRELARQNVELRQQLRSQHQANTVPQHVIDAMNAMSNRLRDLENYTYPQTYSRQ